MRLHSQRRSGATVVECALIYPVFFFLIFALIVGGVGIFRHHQVASLARQAARYAAVHGAQYAKDTGLPAATADSLRSTVIVPNAASLDPEKLSCTVSWDQNNWPYHTDIVNGDIVGTGNTVSVTVTYQWIPELYLGGITLSSTSVLPMAY